MQTFDAVVVGVGAMGAQTCWHLARRGCRVLGLDRYDIPNAMGSSHGEHRIIRLAYFEHPLYVPILRRAYALWRELEQFAGEQLLFVTGSMDIGPEASDVVAGSVRSCREHALPHEVLTAEEVGRRFPGYRLPPDYLAVHQPDGGFIASERAILAAARLALDAGAVIRGHEPVLEITPLAVGGVRVRTERASYEAGRVIVSAGAWVGDLVPELKRLAVPERQVIGWFRPKTPEHFRLGAFPVSNLKCDLGHFYQFPMWTVPGLKIGLYHHLREQGAADALSRLATRRDEDVLRAGLKRFFPDADGDVLALRTCLFTNAPDEHFIIDTAPACSEVIIASPCSGHGFKFSTAIGEMLADMAMGEAPRFDISPFALDRFSPAGERVHSSSLASEDL